MDGLHADDLRRHCGSRYDREPARRVRDRDAARHADRQQPVTTEPRRCGHRLPRHLRAVQRLQLLRRHVGLRRPVLQDGAVLALRDRLRDRLHARSDIGAALSRHRLQVRVEKFCLCFHLYLYDVIRPGS